MARFTLIEAVDSRDQRPYYWLFERTGNFKSRVAVIDKRRDNPAQIKRTTFTNPDFYIWADSNLEYVRFAVSSEEKVIDRWETK
ncbi:hypothetical protein WFI_00057 [Escherichia phage vB_EcoS_WFI]|uniref:Uncharacterized protein n=4 Tax=Dhillonvirus TaxID=1623289 RepID=A0A482N3Q2_9CAUD|nr:hypothetical protein P9603_gp57 [Escherichia phage vB_EcoS_WFI]YP_010740761.1 hypothetical protein P9604_gp41 [Escherichia phage vB_EcoS-CHD5UKE2]YP_010740847.1 hypothetical protein P9605_gp58 [Escherichia phage vB_EcoS_WF5505]YP_010740916.1 hypothetical protein P9606_gp60 [Escherichia phage vB_EcoS-101114BS4]HDJ8553382.1 hypothetical protein [Escherichia coli]QBQ80558.1 hypothetical protein WF5505_00058 [Escherichia phage vB_EcoS_WF5505]QBQ80624.1 hypothetical protein WFI_00057 [Escherich